MTHKKTYARIKPDGDGCDGKHETTLRERCEKIINKWPNIGMECDEEILVSDIEDFAREVIEADRKVRDNQIRNEALEEAASEVGTSMTTDLARHDEIIKHRIRALKDTDIIPALQSRVKELEESIKLYRGAIVEAHDLRKENARLIKVVEAARERVLDLITKVPFLDVVQGTDELQQIARNLERKTEMFSDNEPEEESK